LIEMSDEERKQYLEDVKATRWVSEWVRFQVLSAPSMKVTVFWDVVPCCLIQTDRRFGGVYCLHHQGDARKERINIYERVGQGRSFASPIHSPLTHWSDNASALSDLLLYLDTLLAVCLLIVLMMEAVGTSETSVSLNLSEPAVGRVLPAGTQWLVLCTPVEYACFPNASFAVMYILVTVCLLIVHAGMVTNSTEHSPPSQAGCRLSRLLWK
jgi:hypothetical protein